MHLHVEFLLKRNELANGINPNGPDSPMNQYGQHGQGNLVSYNEQGIPMNSKGLCNSMSNVENYMNNAGYRAPNTLNNAYENQANSSANFGNTGLNNGPGSVDPVNSFTFNNSNIASLNSFYNSRNSFNPALLNSRYIQPTAVDQFNMNISRCSWLPPSTRNYLADNNASTAALLNSSSKSISDLQKWTFNTGSYAGSSVQSAYVNGSSNKQNISDSNLPARETDIIESLQVSTVYFSVFLKILNTELISLD